MTKKVSKFRFTRKNGCVELFWTIDGKDNPKDQYLWLLYKNSKEEKRIWGENSCQGKYHFCLKIRNVITLDTAYVGKKLFGRVNLTRLFKKDYHVYSSGNDVMGCDC